MITYYRSMKSPIGKLLLEATDSHLIGIRFSDAEPFLRRSHAVLDAAKLQLEKYFAGDLEKFDLPLSINGTGFQNKVWNHLLTIRFGNTESYQDVARAIGEKNACRAVGNAVGRNPLPIIIPCHRVLASHGGLGGFSGGLHRKVYMLKLEGSLPAISLPAEEASTVSSALY